MCASLVVPCMHVCVLDIDPLLTLISQNPVNTNIFPDCPCIGGADFRCKTRGFWTPFYHKTLQIPVFCRGLDAKITFSWTPVLEWFHPLIKPYWSYTIKTHPINHYTPSPIRLRPVSWTPPGPSSGPRCWRCRKPGRTARIPGLYRPPGMGNCPFEWSFMVI